MNLSHILLKSPIKFAQGWEDFNVIREGLDIIKNQVIASIIASGDNVLNFLCYEPKKVFAFDISETQIFELKLKFAAINYLSYEEFIILLGYGGENKNRLEIYQSISEKLDEPTKKFWNENLKMISKGFSFQGWWEKYMSLWRYPLKLFLGKDFKRYTLSEDILERKEIFEKRIHRKGLIFLSKLISRKVTINLIFHNKTINNIPDNYDYNNEFWRQIRHFLVDIPCKNNPYHYWILTGKMPDEQKYWQPYLQKNNFNILKKNLYKVEIINIDIFQGLKDIKSDSINCFYLSDIFDWMNLDDMENTLLEVIRTGKNNSKIVYFILNYDKGIPVKIKNNLSFDEKEINKLTRIERVGLYKKVYQIMINK